MFNRIYQHQWMSLEKEVRNHLISIFDIPKTGICEIIDQVVICDGVTNQDLQEITKDRMVAYVGSSEDYPRLWELTLAKVKYELHPPMDFPSIPVEVKEEETKEVVLEIKSSEPFCQGCDSKGIRHKKDCTLKANLN